MPSCAAISCANFSSENPYVVFIRFHHEKLLKLLKLNLSFPNNKIYYTPRSSYRKCSTEKKNVFKNFAKFNFLIKLLACNFIKKETPTQVFSCEFCDISKNTFFTEHVWATASSNCFLYRISCLSMNSISLEYISFSNILLRIGKMEIGRHSEHWCFEFTL